MQVATNVSVLDRAEGLHFLLCVTSDDTVGLFDLDSL